VAGEFYGLGVWRFDSRGWRQLTTANGSNLGIDDNGFVVGEFADGVWVYSGSWVQLTTAHASSLGMSGGG
jgi:hypothetical protein